MGVYSDVGLSTSTEGLEFIKNFVKERDPENNVFTWSHTEDVGGNTTVVFWDFTKWYWEPVDDFEEALKEADNAGHPWEYVQVCQETEYAFRRTSETSTDDLFVHIEWDYTIKTFY